MQNLPFEPEFEQAYKGMSLVLLFFLFQFQITILFARLNSFTHRHLPGIWLHRGILSG